MDAVYNVSDAPSPTHRQSIFGSILRGRPRGNSQSRSALENNRDAQDNHPVPPPPPISGSHRRHPAVGAMHPSVSHGNPTNTSGGLSQILRRRRSANGALSTANPIPPPAVEPIPPRPALSNNSNNNGADRSSHCIRLVPHLEAQRYLHFEPIYRAVKVGDPPLRIGRFTERPGAPPAAANQDKLPFRSKVVSRAHAEIWVEAGGKFFIKDTKSSSGTFLNHVRLSPANVQSNSFALKDGDILQLGIDYQGGEEEIFKCVKMRVELGREWQVVPNAFNTNALNQLKQIANVPAAKKKPAKQSDSLVPGSKTGISDCVICLFGITVNQSLFIAPCSHVFHYKCIRPLLQAHHPGFSCPICRTFADLEEDVEVDVIQEEEEEVMEVTPPPLPSRDASVEPRQQHQQPMDIDTPPPIPPRNYHASNEAPLPSLPREHVIRHEDSEDSPDEQTDSVPHIVAWPELRPEHNNNPHNGGALPVPVPNPGSWRGAFALFRPSSAPGERPTSSSSSPSGGNVSVQGAHGFGISTQPPPHSNSNLNSARSHAGGSSANLSVIPPDMFHRGDELDDQLSVPKHSWRRGAGSEGAGLRLRTSSAGARGEDGHGDGVMAAQHHIIEGTDFRGYETERPATKRKR